MEEFTPLSLKTNGLDVRKESRAFQQVNVPQTSVMTRKARCAGIVRYAVLCPCAKDTCSCYTLTVRSHVLSYHSPDVLVCPGRPEPTQARGVPCLLYQLVSRANNLPVLGPCVNLEREINYCSRPRSIRSEGVQRAGSSPRVIAGALRACNVPGCCPVLSACNVGAAVCDELCRNPVQQDSPTRLLYYN